MATLAEAVAATDRTLEVEDPVDTLIGGELVRLGDELVRFGGYEAAHGAYIGTGAGNTHLDFTRWRVVRGVEGTTGVSHLAGVDVRRAVEAVGSSTDLTPPSPFAGSGEAFNGGTITDPLTVDLAGKPTVAGLTVVDHNGRAMLKVAGADPNVPANAATLHASEHGVTVTLDGLSAGLVVEDRDGAGLFSVAGDGGVLVTPTSPDAAVLDVRRADNSVALFVSTALVGTIMRGAILFDDLPTSDPLNAGQLWNSAGTLKVSAGPPP